MKKTWHELLKNKLASRGDTIIEVMLAISIFALVLVVSLVSTNRSLHSGTDATNRDQALSLAQQQVEFIKNALGTDLQTLQSYVSAPQTFCINPANGAVQDASASNNPCNQFGGSQYDLVITHTSGADNTTVFKVTTTWPSSVSNTTDSAYVYYKVPKAGPNPPIISNCSVTVTSSTAPGAVTMAGHIDPNGLSTTWHFSYGTSTSLGTNLPVPDGGPLTSPADVSQSVSSLSGGNYYFSLIATNTDGITNCSSLGTFTITTPPPPPAAPTVNLISVTHTTSNDTYHVRGTIDPNGTPNTHPYMSIGRTCDSGGDEDNPGVGTGNQKYNAALNKYENPKGPFSDSTTHNENADMADTQFSFYFCGHNDPYKFQQCAWWG
ncbi:MAG: type IV pilus modification PilV family protein, partial [Candidatus Saccharimonadales bacterium]